MCPVYISILFILNYRFMRTTIATIHLVLRTNKRLSTGLFPIMLRCNWKSMKEVSTGYSCSIKDWDKRNECCKKSMQNFVMVNYELKKLKDAAIKKRDSFIASGIIYTPSMVLEKEEVSDIIRNDLKGLIERYISEKGIKSRTIEHWWVVYHSIESMTGRSDIIISEVNEAFCRRFAKHLEGEGKSDCTIRSYLSKIGALCHYAINNGLITVYPFSKWRYNRVYQESKREYYIHYKSLLVLKDIFTNYCVEFTGDGRWRYKDNVIEELMDRNSKIYGLMLYIAGIVYKGLAPIDISYLRKEDISVIRIGESDYYKIDGSRQKTGMKYKIRIEKDDILSRLCVDTYLMFHNESGNYLFPTMDGFVGKHMNKRVNNTYMYHSEHLKDWFRLCNDEIVKRNVRDGDNIPLIDIEHCNYYSYRHSVVMMEIQKPNCNFLALAQMIGKSSRTLYQYISELTNEEDLV